MALSRVVIELIQKNVKENGVIEIKSLDKWRKQHEGLALPAQMDKIHHDSDSILVLFAHLFSSKITFKLLEDSTLRVMCPQP